MAAPGRARVRDVSRAGGGARGEGVLTSRDVLAFANGCYSAHHGCDAVDNPYAAGASAKHWLRGWRLMRKILEREKTETTEKKEVKR